MLCILTLTLEKAGVSIHRAAITHSDTFLTHSPLPPCPSFLSPELSLSYLPPTLHLLVNLSTLTRFSSMAFTLLTFLPRLPPQALIPGPSSFLPRTSSQPSASICMEMERFSVLVMAASIEAVRVCGGEGESLVVVMGGTVIMMVCWHCDLYSRGTCLTNGVAYCLLVILIGSQWSLLRWRRY